MKMTYDKKTGVANEVVLKDLSCAFRDAIGRISQYLDLELIRYNRDSMKPIPDDVFDDAHNYIEKVRKEFNEHLDYYRLQNYINPIDARKTYKAFHETIATLEDVYLYKTVYRKSSFHCDWINYDEEYKERAWKRLFYLSIVK